MSYSSPRGVFSARPAHQVKHAQGFPTVRFNTDTVDAPGRRWGLFRHRQRLEFARNGHQNNARTQPDPPGCPHLGFPLPSPLGRIFFVVFVVQIIQEVIRLKNPLGKKKGVIADKTSARFEGKGGKIGERDTSARPRVTRRQPNPF